MIKDDNIYCMDAIDGLKRLDSNSIDMILCDLPYGITSNKWDVMIPLEPLWYEYKRVIKDTGLIALTASQPFTSTLVMSNISMFKHEWIWIKNQGSNFANTVREPMKEHESVLIFANKKWTYNKQMQERAESGKSRVKYNVKFETKSDNYNKFDGRLHNKLSDLRVPSSWQRFEKEVGLHPNQKPVALFEYLIKTYTNENDTIVDNACGSGTTAVACINSNRRYIVWDNNSEYIKIAKNRLGLLLRCYL